MRCRTATQVQEGEQIDITPMLDIVFIMLIFFIVTSSFVKEYSITLSRPASIPQKSNHQNQLVIRINADDTIQFDDRPVSLAALRANIEQADAVRPKAMAIILTHRQASTGTLVQVMDQAKLAGIDDIAVSARSEDPV